MTLTNLAWKKPLLTLKALNFFDLVTLDDFAFYSEFLGLEYIRLASS